MNEAIPFDTRSLSEKVSDSLCQGKRWGNLERLAKASVSVAGKNELKGMDRADERVVATIAQTVFASSDIEGESPGQSIRVPNHRNSAANAARPSATGTAHERIRLLCSACPIPPPNPTMTP